MLMQCMQAAAMTASAAAGALIVDAEWAGFNRASAMVAELSIGVRHKARAGFGFGFHLATLQLARP